MIAKRESISRGRANCMRYAVTKVACHEMAGCNMMFVIQLDLPAICQPWQALRAAAAFDASLGKYFIAVDSDIDPDSLESIMWAMAFSTHTHRDAEIIRGTVLRVDPSVPSSSDMDLLGGQGASAMLNNACREHPLPAGLPAALRLHGESVRALG
ncbi:MAG: UbiD family decarboxylase [Alphaproteobacteria bacterium]|nr:UbiD family decarboxylase [Alphaproteobacteria bacterium]